MDVAGPESIADHMYRMACMALLMTGNRTYDHSRLLKMAIVHDIAEALVGDITPVDGVSDSDKRAREEAALRQMMDMLGEDTAAAQEMSDLWCASWHVMTHCNAMSIAPPECNNFRFAACACA